MQEMYGEIKQALKLLREELEFSLGHQSRFPGKYFPARSLRPMYLVHVAALIRARQFTLGSCELCMK